MGQSPDNEPWAVIHQRVWLGDKKALVLNLSTIKTSDMHPGDVVQLGGILS